MSPAPAGYILAIAAVLYPPLAILIPKGIAPLFAIAGIAALVVGFDFRRLIAVARGPVSLGLAALAALALVSAAWSITPMESLKTGISFAATLFGSVVLFTAADGLDDGGRRVFKSGLLAGGVIGVALLGFEIASDAWLTRFMYGLAGKRIFFDFHGQGYKLALKPGLAAMILYFWPWAVVLRTWLRKTLAVAAVAMPAVLLAVSGADAVVFGLIAGSAVFVFGLAAPRIVAWVMGSVVALGILFAPLVPGTLPDPRETGEIPAWLSHSAVHRIVIWHNTAALIKERPVLGAGFDSSRAFYGDRDKVSYFIPGRDGKPDWKTQYEPIPLHPHNTVLQTWLEMGALGAGILLAVLLAVFRAIHRRAVDGLATAAAFGFAATALSIACISFGAWQSWWLTSVLLSSVFMAATGGLVQAGGDRTPVAPPPADSGEIGGPKGPEPTRYGDWERKGRAIDF